MVRTALVRICVSILMCVAPAAQPRRAGPTSPGDVLVILWFDTEDYLLPASDDAAKRVAEILAARGVRGTFKVVGEKARVLEQRGRADVIAALKQHDIGYHSNLHSVHPTPAEYLADSGWSEGVAEFARREGGGARDVMRVFGVRSLSCYGQPGSSWAPQSFGALREIGVLTSDGIPAYVDEGTHVGVGDQPFWYAGALTVYRMGPNATRMELHDPDGVERGRAEFRAAYDRLRAAGGGLISVYYHPAEWVHREFWDAVNFSRGANPPREAWRQPPQRPAAESEAAYRRFEAYVDFQRSLTGVRHVTASELPRLYVDPIRRDGVALATVRQIAAQVAGAEVLDVLRDAAGSPISPADQFAMITTVLAEVIERGTLSGHVRVPGLLGPPEAPPQSRAGDLPWPAFRDAIVAAAAEMRARNHVPARVFIGATPHPPADFLRAAAGVVATLSASAPAAFPARVSIPAGVRIGTERFVAEDTPDLFGGWVIHPEGFRGPKLVALARLQAWTLKPGR